MRKLLFTIFSIFTTFTVFAEDTPESAKKTTKPAPTDSVQTAEQKKEAAEGKFTFSGYLDAYYFGNLNNPSTRSNLGITGVERAFDQRAGQFGIGLVQTKASYTSNKIDGVIDLAFGPFADLGNYGNVLSLNVGAATSTSLAIKQAYFTWKTTPKLSFTAGQFGTHIGYEVIDAPVNYNYSLSNLFNNGPFYHIGIKGQYAFSDKAYLMLGLVNNVDNIQDNNRAKGLIGQLFFSPVSGWNVYLNAIVSNEANADSLGKTRGTNSYSLFDLTTTYQITEKFFLGVNAAAGSQKGDYQGGTFADKSKGWGGVALYTNYAFSSAFGLGARYETFDNSSGIRFLRDPSTGEGRSVNSFTLTANITAADGHLLLKPELRVDSYDKNTFFDERGNVTKKSQTTLGMAAIFKF
ncbi:MAG: porin [Cytophagaceae bacterium]|nr:porin [Cytophagaceae bacterium]